LLAQANAEAERPMDAIAEYLEAIKLAPMQPGLHEELGSEYSSAQSQSKRKPHSAANWKSDSHNALARYKLGVLAIAQGDGARAKESIEAAIKKKKPGLRILTTIWRRNAYGEDENALDTFSKATRN